MRARHNFSLQLTTGSRLEMTHFPTLNALLWILQHCFAFLASFLKEHIASACRLTQANTCFQPAKPKTKSYARERHRCITFSALLKSPKSLAQTYLHAQCGFSPSSISSIVWAGALVYVTCFVLLFLFRSFLLENCHALLHRHHRATQLISLSLWSQFVLLTWIIKYNYLHY